MCAAIVIDLVVLEDASFLVVVGLAAASFLAVVVAFRVPLAEAYPVRKLVDGPTLHNTIMSY